MLMSILPRFDEGQNVVRTNGKHLAVGWQHELLTHTNEFDEQVRLQTSKIEQSIPGAQ